MERIMFDSATPEARAQMLRDNCDEIEESTYTRRLNEYEKDDLRIRLAENHVLISKESDVLQKAKDEYKLKTKLPEKENAMIIHSLRSGTEEVDGELFKFVDFDERMVGFYDIEGNLISSRPCRPDEMQRTIFSEARKI